MKYFLILILLVSSSAFALRSSNFSEITNGDMSQSSIIGSPILLDQVSTVSLQANWTDAPVGNLDIQVSDDMGIRANDGSVTGIVNWSEIPGSLQPTNGLSASNFSWNLPDIGYRWVRVTYSRTSGTGTLNVRSQTKGP